MCAARSNIHNQHLSEDKSYLGTDVFKDSSPTCNTTIKRWARSLCLHSFHSRYWEIHFQQQGLVRRCIVIWGCITLVAIAQIIKLGSQPVRYTRCESASGRTNSWLSFIEYNEFHEVWRQRHVNTEEDTASQQSSSLKEDTASGYHHCRLQAQKIWKTTHCHFITAYIIFHAHTTFEYKPQTYSKQFCIGCCLHYFNLAVSYTHLTLPTKA